MVPKGACFFPAVSDEHLCFRRYPVHRQGCLPASEQADSGLGLAPRPVGLPSSGTRGPGGWGGAAAPPSSRRRPDRAQGSGEPRPACPGGEMGAGPRQAHLPGHPSPASEGSAQHSARASGPWPSGRDAAGCEAEDCPAFTECREARCQTGGGISRRAWACLCREEGLL